MGIKIVIFCETKLTSSVIKHAIVNHQHSNMEVIGCATRANDARAYIEQGYCDILLVHSQLKGQSSLSLVENFSVDYPKPDIIVFGLPKSKQMILSYLEGGASGYILQNDSVPKMLKKIQAVYDQRPIICPQITGSLVNRVNELANSRHRVGVASKNALAELTPREKEVLALLGEELSNQEIANRLFIEVGTVKNHVHRLLKKLGVRSRYDAADYLPLLRSNGTPVAS